MYSYFIFHLLSLFPHFFLHLTLCRLTPHPRTDRLKSLDAPLHAHPPDLTFHQLR
jgi:hypothetical protein